mmetsp:Transcript_102174/g.304991  ORF Transcript_102174/g.304991 Transcript_102174/m.304991 type:complete len:164 (+) Transcript_102174:123-614(+)
MAVKPESLAEFIDTKSLECLNQVEGNPVGNAFTGDDSFLQSDTDHQLLIKVSFRQPVKLHSIKFKAFKDESAPTTIKVFKGKENIGFNEAEDEEAAENLMLDPDTLDTFPEHTVRFVRFQCVQSLQLFVAENNGAEATKIQQIDFRGMPASSMDMKDWKPCKA